MGPRLKLPPYVHAFIDRHGKARFYFRRAGFNRIALPGLPWSSEFMDAYERAKAGQARIEIGATRTSVGTVAALVVAYLNSAAFHSLAPESRRTRRNILERFRVEHGDKRVALLQREHIERMLSAKIGTPVAALNWLVTLRVLMQFAVQNGMRRDDRRVT